MPENNYPPRLLAKKVRGATPEFHETLEGHLECVMDVGTAIIKTIGNMIIESMKLDVTLDELDDALSRAAFFHDVGKANSDFQTMISRGVPSKQVFRHEWLSGLILVMDEGLGKWAFKGCSNEVECAIVYAVIGHHLEMSDMNELRARNGSSYDADYKMYLGHPDFKAMLDKAGKKLGLGRPPELEDMSIDILDSPLSVLQDYLMEKLALWSGMTKENRRLMAALKALLISSDVAGSAVPNHNVSHSEWVGRVLGRNCSKDDIEKIIKTKLGASNPRKFQEKVAGSGSRMTFVRAGCGSGKTLAAYMWAANRADGKKLFFCYPTTGTATEGYKDYVIAGDLSADALLLHGRKDLDMQYMRENSEFDAAETAIKCESLEAWDVPLVICTVDQTVNIVQNGRKPLFTFPAIANGAFVFDEIHLYDDRLFGGFLKFITAFRGAPMLLMTATLPKGRLEAIREALKHSGEKLKVIKGPADLEEIKRYRINAPMKQIDWVCIKKAYDGGHKILWVANTVSRCMQYAAAAISNGMTPVVYHSRFKYVDRIEKHGRVINAFNDGKGVIAITTQVCEVSLDISADLLVTEMAPVPAMIQRMGRLNRKMPVKDVKDVIVLEAPDAKPYETGNLHAAGEWMKNLLGRDLSQKDLADAYESMTGSAMPEDVFSEWLEGGQFSKWAPGRDADNSALFIMQGDAASCIDKRGKLRLKEISKYAIPMTLAPVSREIGGWKMLGYAFCLPEGRIDYDKEMGAKWRKN